MLPAEVTAKSLASRVSDALLKRAEGVSNLKAWRWRCAEAIECDPRTFEKMMYAEQCPSATLLYRMFVYFDPGFKGEIDAGIEYETARAGDVQEIRDANLLGTYRTAFTQFKGVIADTEAKDVTRLKAVG